MKKTKLFIALSSFALAAAGLFAVGASGAKKVEASEATNISSYAKVYRFTAPAEYWGDTVYVHAWGSETADNNTEWPGINISSQYSYNESDRKVFTFSTDVADYQYLIFHNNNGWQTDNITIGSDTAWYLDGGNTPGTWVPSNQTYYFYDYNGYCSNSPICKAKQSYGSLDNGAGVAMVKMSHTSRLYSVSLDPAFDQFEIKNGSVTLVATEWINHHRNHVYCLWSDPAWFDNINYVTAHDWCLQTMHIRDIATSVTSDTGACRGDSGYYKKAKEDYQSFSAEIKGEMQYILEFDIAKARFSAWATACGETASWDNSSLTVSKSNMIYHLTSEESANIVPIIIVISLVSVSTLGALLIIKKRRVNN